VRLSTALALLCVVAPRGANADSCPEPQCFRISGKVEACAVHRLGEARFIRVELSDSSVQATRCEGDSEVSGSLGLPAHGLKPGTFYVSGLVADCGGLPHRISSASVPLHCCGTADDPVACALDGMLIQAPE
jgi:hypothetical protein